MPHKHRRDKAKLNPAYYDLAPTKSIRALPTTKLAKASSPRSLTTTKKNSTHERRSKASQDDTPRAFSRLLGPYRPPRSGQDDGIRMSKKRKRSQQNASDTTTGRKFPSSAPPTTLTISKLSNADEGAALRIQPNEPLAHFAARVDAALPFSSLAKSASSTDPTLRALAKGRKTKTEKKMQRMQREWRKEEARRKERAEEGKGDDGEGAVDESGAEAMGVDEEEEGGGSVVKKGKKGKRKKGGDEDDEDPWQDIAAKRKENARDVEGGGAGLVGLHDVVQAPPRFTKRPGFKTHERIRPGDGGLKKQFELSEARRSVVDGYRAMMRQKREAISANT